MQVRNQGWGQEVYHMPHSWVNSCIEAGFSMVGAEVFHNPGQIHVEG